MSRLFAHLRDHTVIGYLDAGERVDIFWGPEDHMYEVRASDGTVGWIWAEFLDPDGGGSGGGEASSAPAGNRRLHRRARPTRPAPGRGAPGRWSTPIP